MSDKSESTTGVDTMPSSVTEVEPLVKEFVEKLQNIKNEQELLKQDEKELWEEYSEKLDTKVLKQAMRCVAIREKVEHKVTFDLFEECLTRM